MLSWPIVGEIELVESGGDVDFDTCHFLLMDMRCQKIDPLSRCHLVPIRDRLVVESVDKVKALIKRWNTTCLAYVICSSVETIMGNIHSLGD